MGFACHYYISKEPKITVLFNLIVDSPYLPGKKQDYFFRLTMLNHDNQRIVEAKTSAELIPAGVSIGRFGFVNPQFVVFLCRLQSLYKSINGYADPRKDIPCFAPVRTANLQFKLKNR
jgi:hypothetical protein